MVKWVPMKNQVEVIPSKEERFIKTWLYFS
jgi:hypothetical protein